MNHYLKYIVSANWKVHRSVEGLFSLLWFEPVGVK